MDSASTSSSTYTQNFKLLACFCDCICLFISDLVGNPSCWVSHAKAHILDSKFAIRLIDSLQFQTRDHESYVPFKYFLAHIVTTKLRGTNQKKELFNVIIITLIV